MNPAADGWYRNGNSHQDAGEHPQAEQCFRSAIAAEPAHAKAWNNLGVSLQAQGRTGPAMTAYRTALAHDAALPQPNANLAHLCAAGGDLAGAAACYVAALKHHPGDPRLEHMLAAVRGETSPHPPAGYAAAYFDEVAHVFDQHLVCELGYGVPRLLAEAVAPLLAGRAPCRVLDLGCGTGLVGAALHAVLPSPVLAGVDASCEMLRQARRRGLYSRLALGDLVAELHATPPGSLDAVVAADVFIYLGALDTVFDAVAAALVPGGAFVFSLEQAARGDYVLRPTGRYAHSDAYIEALARRCGFAACRLETIPLRREEGQIQSGSLAVLSL
jgi:predicted TPR repeat methyltransferase